MLIRALIGVFESAQATLLLKTLQKHVLVPLLVLIIHGLISFPSTVLLAAPQCHLHLVIMQPLLAYLAALKTSSATLRPKLVSLLAQLLLMVNSASLMLFLRLASLSVPSVKIFMAIRVTTVANPHVLEDSIVTTVRSVALLLAPASQAIGLILSIKSACIIAPQPISPPIKLIDCACSTVVSILPSETSIVRYVLLFALKTIGQII